LGSQRSQRIADDSKSNADGSNGATVAASHSRLTKEGIKRFRLMVDKCARTKEIMRKATVDQLFAQDNEVSFRDILIAGLDGYKWDGDSEVEKAKASVDDLIRALPIGLTYRALLLEPWPGPASGRDISLATGKVLD
jgi:hypothetical protein